MKTSIICGAFLLLCGGLPAQELSVQETHRFQFVSGVTRSLAFSPDEKYLACGGELGDLTVYDLELQSRVLDLDIGHSPVRQIVFFANGKRLAVLAEDLSIWSFPKGQRLDRWSVASLPPDLSCMTVSADSKWIAWRQDQKILIRAAENPRIVAIGKVAWRRLGTLQFSANGKQLLVGSSFVWNWQDKDSKLSPLSVSKGRGRVQSALWVGPDSRLLIATATKGLWLGDHRADLSSVVRHMTASRDGSRILVRLDNRRLLLFNDRLEPLRSIRIQSAFLHGSSALSSSGRLVAWASDEDPVRIWSTGETLPFSMRRELASVRRPGDPLMFLPGNAARPESLAFAAGGKNLALAVANRIVAIDLADGRRRQLGPGTVVATGWRSAEILIGQTEDGTVSRAQADSGAMSRLCGVSHSFLEISPAHILTSPKQVRFLYTMAGITRSHAYYLWSQSEPELEWDDYPSYHDATWSRDGDSLLLITSLPSCIGAAVPSVKIRSLSQAMPWQAAASRASSRIQGPLTGDFSRGRDRVTWGGRKGAVTYTRTADGKGDIHTNLEAHMVWLRYLGKDYFLSHDEQILSLWKAKDHKLLDTSNPFQVPEALKRGYPLPKAKPQDPTSTVEVPLFIHQAVLSRDRKRLALVGNRDVRVYDVRIR